MLLTNTLHKQGWCGSEQKNGAKQVGVGQAPPPPLRKHQESKENDSHTGSWCLDKAILPRDARYQKNVCRRKLAPSSP